VHRQVNLVLIGPPGSGKGTQAARIKARYGIPAISTGDILRAAVKAGTPLGRTVQATLTSGGLVNDGLMIDLVRDRLAQPDTQPGFILDGFPRTLGQATALEGLLGGRPLTAILLDVPESLLERRLSSRRICSTCKTLYTTASAYAYGSEAELCSKCGSVLITRDDDNLETVRTRLKTYRETAAPLIRHYRDKGLLATIDGSQPQEDVTVALLKAIDARTG
jgi:adenylate kinase